MLYDCVTLCPIVNQYSCGQGKSHYKNEVEEIHQENPRFTKCKAQLVVLVCNTT